MKLVRCRDHGFDCDFEARAESEEEILERAGEHAQTVHNLEITPELVEQVKQTIHNLPDEPQ